MASSDAVHVCLIGHSYIRRLQEFMLRHLPDQFDNLGFDRSRVVIHCIGVGGATVLSGDKCIEHHLAELISIQPAIVYMHMGENDLQSMHGSVSPITARLHHLIQQIIPHTKIVYVSQLLLFPVYNNIRESVLSINNDLKVHCAQLQTVNYWRHRGGFWNQPVTLMAQAPRSRLFDRHGVHLNEEGNKAYWQSVHVAVEKGLQMLNK